MQLLNIFYVIYLKERIRTLKEEKGKKKRRGTIGG